MTQLICNAFYCKDKEAKSPGMGKTASGLEIYLKNIFVSLVSAKKNNPDSDVMLVTNIKENALGIFDQLIKENIKIVFCPFDNFLMPDNFKWQYAFYKLKVLEYIKELKYDRYLLMDCDTYVVDELKDLWKETAGRILLYDTRHKISHPVRESIGNDWFRIKGTTRYPTQWGGEFICLDSVCIDEFVKELNNIYSRIKEIDYNIDNECGDEMLLSVAAEEKSLLIRPANAYIERFWNRGFYLVSTNWDKDPVLVWHLPADKKYGMIDLYNYYNRNGHFPSKNKAARILNLPKSNPGLTMSMMKYYKGKLMDKILK